MHSFLKNRNFKYCRSKYKKENPRCNFVERSVLYLLAFFVGVLPQNRTFYKPFEICRFFYQKTRDMTSLKGHFPKNFPMDFADTLCEDVKLMVNMVS